MQRSRPPVGGHSRCGADGEPCARSPSRARCSFVQEGMSPRPIGRENARLRPVVVIDLADEDSDVLATDPERVHEPFGDARHQTPRCVDVARRFAARSRWPRHAPSFDCRIGRHDPRPALTPFRHERHNGRPAALSAALRDERRLRRRRRWLSPRWSIGPLVLPRSRRDPVAQQITLWAGRRRSRVRMASVRRASATPRRAARRPARRRRRGPTSGPAHRRCRPWRGRCRGSR